MYPPAAPSPSRCGTLKAGSVVQKLLYPYLGRADTASQEENGMRHDKECTRVLRIGMMLVLPIGLASCAPEDTDDWTAPDPITDDRVGVRAEPITVDIDSEDTNVEGEATITRVNDTFTIALNLENLPGAGPFQAHIVTGRCEDVRRMAGMPVNNGTTMPAPGTQDTLDMQGTPGTPGTMGTPGTQTPARGQVGQELASLQDVRVTAANDQAGMSTSNVSVSELRGHQAAIVIRDPNGLMMACGDLENLDEATAAPGTAPGTSPGTGTAPGTPGTGTTRP